MEQITFWRQASVLKASIVAFSLSELHELVLVEGCAGYIRFLPEYANARYKYGCTYHHILNVSPIKCDKPQSLQVGPFRKYPRGSIRRRP
jgi:hypothetical protein